MGLGLFKETTNDLLLKERKNASQGAEHLAFFQEKVVFVRLLSLAQQRQLSHTQLDRHKRRVKKKRSGTATVADNESSYLIVPILKVVAKPFHRSLC